MSKRRRPFRKRAASRFSKYFKKTDKKKQAKIAGFSSVVKKMLLKKLESCDELLDAQDMKQLFKVGDNTLRNWRMRELIVGSKMGRGFFYHKAMVYLMLIKNLGGKE